MNSKLPIAAAAAVLGLFSHASSITAAVLPTTTALSNPTGTATFNEFPSAVTDRSAGADATTTNGETVHFNSLPLGDGSVETSGKNYGLQLNGNWGSPRQFVSLSAVGPTPSSLQFTFTGGDVSGFSGFFNYPSSSNVTLTAFNPLGVAIGSFDISGTAPIVTPGAVNDGAYRGLSGTSNEIHSFTISGQNVVLDDLSFARAIPEPATLAAIAVFGGLLLRRRR